MAKTWLDSIDERDLIAVIPARALKASDNKALKARDSEERAATIIAEDLSAKGLTGVRIAWEIPKAGRTAAKQKAILATKAQKKARPMSYKSIWASVKREFYLLLCTKDGKYAALRKKLAKYVDEASMVIIGTVAAAIAKVIGVVAGICTPFIALLLLAVGSVGKNVWCETVKPQ